MARKRDDEAPKDTGAKLGLRPQPHGGALQRGNPGNRGGGRRSLAAIRRFDDMRDATLLQLEEKLTARELTVHEMIALASLAARHTVPLPKERVDRELISELAGAVDAVLSELDGGEEAKQAIYDRWAMTLGRWGTKE